MLLNLHEVMEILVEFFFFFCKFMDHKHNNFYPTTSEKKQVSVISVFSDWKAAQ